MLSFILENRLSGWYVQNESRRTENNPNTRGKFYLSTSLTSRDCPSAYRKLELPARIG